MEKIKVRIGSYDVEISAYNWVTEETGTLSFLNNLSLVYRSAAETEDRKGYQAHKEDYENTAHDLFVVCEENGLYDRAE